MLLEEPPLAAQLVTCIILSYKRGKKDTLFLPLVHPRHTALGRCNFVWLGRVSHRSGEKKEQNLFGSKGRYFPAVVEKALSSG